MVVTEIWTDVLSDFALKSGFSFERSRPRGKPLGPMFSRHVISGSVDEHRKPVLNTRLLTSLF